MHDGYHRPSCVRRRSTRTHTKLKGSPSNGSCSILGPLARFRAICVALRGHTASKNYVVPPRYNKTIPPTHSANDVGHQIELFLSHSNCLNMHIKYGACNVMMDIISQGRVYPKKTHTPNAISTDRPPRMLAMPVMLVTNGARARARH